MPTTLAKPKKRKQRQRLDDTPNYIVISPPGRIVREKIAEMEMEPTELAKRMDVPIETVEQLFLAKIPLTEELAEKIENVTEMSAHVMMRFEVNYRERLAYAMKHPEIPAFLGDEIINQPKQGARKI